MFDKGMICSVASYMLEDLVLRTNTIYGTQLVPNRDRINVRILARIDTEFCPAGVGQFLIELADYPLCGSTPFSSDFIFSEV